MIHLEWNILIINTYAFYIYNIYIHVKYINHWWEQILNYSIITKLEKMLPIIMGKCSNSNRIVVMMMIMTIMIMMMIMMMIMTMMIMMMTIIEGERQSYEKSLIYPLLWWKAVIFLLIISSMTLSYLISSYLISSYFIYSYSIPCYPVLTPFLLNSSDLIFSYHPTYRILSLVSTSFWVIKSISYAPSLSWACRSSESIIFTFSSLILVSSATVFRRSFNWGNRRIRY